MSDTEYYAQGRYTSADKVRFVSGLPEKIGGWTQWNIDGDELPDICRSMLCWLDYNYNLWHAFGTSGRLWVFDQDMARTNITPYESTGTLNNPFSTTDTLATVNVNDAAHSVVVDQYVNFSGATAVGGITIDGEYQVTSVVDADNYVITHSSPATSTAGPGGGASVAYSYELEDGNPNITYGGGWGLGTWGSGTWGTEHSSVTYVQYPRYWSLDKYGQYLLAMPSGGTLYQWNASIAARAAAVSNAPSTGLYMFVTSERIVVVLGADGDFMNMKWCDDDDNTVWTPLSTNSANSRKLQEGSRMVAGTRLIQQVNLVWTDTALYLMQYTGSNKVYSTRMVAKDVGLIGPGAFVVENGVAYWMTNNQFMFYNGTADRIPNSEDVQAVFDDLHPQQRVKVSCFHNPDFREIWWLYPSLNSNEPDKYVILCLDDYSWTPGTIDRTICGVEYLNGKATVLGVDTSGFIFAHEDGVDDDTVSMPWELETSYLDLQDGAVSVNIDGYIPDFQRQVGTIDLTFTSREYPEDAAALETLATTITTSDSIVDLRHFGRQIKVKLSQDVLGGDFALGKSRIEAGVSGTRRGG